MSDEREVLAMIVEGIRPEFADLYRSDVGGVRGREWKRGLRMADAILAAGFTRSRPATEPSEDEVEAAAKALWWTRWESEGDVYRMIARGALRAAREVEQ